MSEALGVGRIVAGKYRLDEELGRGGMGAVYRARHLGVHKDFAIKLLLGDLLARKAIVSRFFLEAQAAGRIGHPGILEVYDVGEDADGAPFIVMELLTGEPLSALVHRGPLPVDAACWIAIQVLEVLAAAHQAGVIHRDVKPQNVFLTERHATGGAGSVRGVKLLDFGIAKFTTEGGSVLTRSGEIIGSPLYMAPEQAKGEEDVDARVDVWSVGAMLFEMLTGRCAHVATTPVAVLAKILTERAPAASSQRADLPPELDEVVARALEIDRAARWPSARAMIDALTAVRDRLGTTATIPALPAPLRPAARSIEPAISRTPAALASTVLDPSSPPPPGGSNATQPSGPAWRRTAGAAALFVAGGAALFVGLRAAPSSRSAAALDASVIEPSAAGSEAIAPTDAATSVAIARDASAPETAAVLDDASTTEPPASASSTRAKAAPPGRPAGAEGPSRGAPARCAQGEALSNGHCCPRGTEWQGTRCERPLAESF